MGYNSWFWVAQWSHGLVTSQLHIKKHLLFRLIYVLTVVDTTEQALKRMFGKQYTNIACMPLKAD